MSVQPSAPPSKNEVLKQNDPTLGGTLGETMADSTLACFSSDDEQFLKFHGIYQQDDRDRRKTGKQYIMMIRARIPGGLIPPDQYLAFDDLSERYGNQTLRITSRQSFQWHGVVKDKLGPLMKGLNDALCTTIAACGDVARNVMAPSTPAMSALAERVLEDARRVDAAVKPQTAAYHSIWIDGEPLKLSPEGKQAFEDPLYGKTYLPRKFKIAFALPPLNDTDVFTNCLGFVAIPDPAEPSRVLGYNVLVGGGLGMSHGNKETFPRTADVLGFIAPEEIVAVTKAVLTAYRDSGDRTNRKHARLKYVIEELGVDWFRAEVEQRAGFKLAPARPMDFTHQGDRFGWHQQSDGRWFLGLYVETGRIKDVPQRQLKTALRRVVAKFRPEVRLTPSQNLLLAGLTAAQKAGLTALLAEHGIPVENQAGAIRRASMACPSMPTCGLGLAESERALPGILDSLETVLAELGLSDEEIIIRMTGCPNGCARPYMAEIGFVGKAPGKYNLYLGGNAGTTRLNREYRASVKTEDLSKELRPLLTRWKNERRSGERFGDFCSRTVLPEQIPVGAAGDAAPTTLSPAAPLS
ncbi:MAG: NADPH-dependent assimilatory sulfite reductase hemoprotein subunit [bacterium]|nr:NADPH-dependent assimilatory sulfite reductase hemoprotein subunit [bacterium]MDI1337069.1 NADPH-dependent assimilatory sulfite reductase hemoprotein subunit [Lacunisphaera sp.]